MKETKISKKTSALIIIGILIVIYGLIFLIYHIQTTPHRGVTSKRGLTSTTTIYENTRKAIPTTSNVKYSTLETVISGATYSSVDNVFVTSNEELIKKINQTIKTNVVKDYESSEKIYISEKFNDEFFENNNLAIQMYSTEELHHHYSIASVIKENSNATINIKDEYTTYGGLVTPTTTLVFIPLSKEIKNVDFDIYTKTINNSYDSNYGVMFMAGIIIAIIVIVVTLLIISSHNKKIDNKYNIEQSEQKQNKMKKGIITTIIVVMIIVIIFFAILFYEAMMTRNTAMYKPIIYLYPTEETEVSVNLGYPDKITCSYPQYTTSWNVLAKTNGDLVDLSTKRNLYSLYYESTNVIKFDIRNDGFVVKGTDVAEFLEEKLAILGLTEREAEEFIVYWLPKLQENKYNYIRFATLEEINANMPLEFSVKPDTLIRVLMTYKGLINSF